MKKTLRFILPGLLLLLLLSGFKDAYASAPVDMTFTVTRNGEPIGTHSYKFKKIDTNRQQVDIKTDIEVSVAFITVYKFRHRATEEWYGDRFLGTNSSTDDDGTDKKLKVTMGNDTLNVDSNGQRSSLRYGILPASLWNPETVNKTMLLNTLDGSKMKVFVKNLGIEEIEVRKSITPAKHYQITGELERDIWFDETGQHLLQVRFKGDDGSDIMYVLN